MLTNHPVAARAFLYASRLGWLSKYSKYSFTDILTSFFGSCIFIIILIPASLRSEPQKIDSVLSVFL